MVERFSCALRSRVLGEPCYGTASQVRRWILVEQPGGWGANAVLQSRLPQDVAVRLRATARSLGARLLLIRRHGRSDPVRRTCFAAVSTAGVRRVERLRFDDPAELVDVDWSPLRDLSPVGGDVVDRLYLVCTNGSHYTCCAEFGRPVAQALDAVLDEGVWEASHFGGDRFAANLLCLPRGVYYGRVGPGEGPRIVADYEAGRLDLDHYRGRSCYPFIVQAGEHFVRETEQLHDLDELWVRGVRPVRAGSVRVTVLTADGREVSATVAQEPAPAPRALTCHAASVARPPTYRLVGYEVRAAERV